LRTAIGSTAGDDGEEGRENAISNLEDGFIGFVAIAARQGIAQWRMMSLEPDDQMRVCMSEVIASILSLWHWFMRYFVLMRDEELALTKLGGSTAVVDASCAVMLAFSEPPLLVSSIGRFDPTARLLTALLISLTVLQRCLYASASCAVRWTAARNNPECGPSYELIIFFGVLLWLAQSVSVGIVLADCFAVPSAFSMTRSNTGNFVYAANALFFTIVVAGMPQLLRTSRRIQDLKV